MRLVKESIDENSSFENLKKEEIVARRKELKAQGYHVRDSKVSKGFTAKKDDERITVRLNEG